MSFSVGDLMGEIESNALYSHGYSLSEMVQRLKEPERTEITRKVIEIMVALPPETFKLVLDAAFDPSTKSNAAILVELLKEVKL